MAFDLLYATRVGVNRDSLAVDLRVDAHRPEDPENRFRGASATPRLVMSVDGCPVDPPRVLGALSYGKGADGRIVMRRNELPIGDLVLVFEAFGQQHTMLFANDAKGLRTILPEEHKNYRETPGDPARGEEPASGFVTPDCGNGGQQAVQGGAP